LRAFATVVKVVLRFVPRVWTTTTIATEIPAAIRQYSMAVAAASSFRKEKRHSGLQMRRYAPGW
jgi:hypothetical protein